MIAIKWVLDDDNDDYQDAQNPVCGEKLQIWGMDIIHLEINLCFEGFIVDHTGENVKSLPMLIFSMAKTAYTKK